MKVCDICEKEHPDVTRGFAPGGIETFICPQCSGDEPWPYGWKCPRCGEEMDSPDAAEGCCDWDCPTGEYA